VRVNKATAHNTAGAKKHSKQTQQAKQAQSAKQPPSVICSQKGKRQVRQATELSYSQNDRKHSRQSSTATYSQTARSVDEDSAGLVSQSIVKRGMDILLSLVALIVLAPLFVIVAIFIRLDSAGPAVFKQRRIGWAGKEFTLYKLRSMHVGNDARVHKDYMTKLIRGADASSNLRGSNGCFKLEKDARITRVGKFLRKTSIDELPQIVNVLKGDMSLVGPRPALSYEVEIYKPWHGKRLLARPGLTGLWQVGGRSEKNFDEMVELDIQYINEWSLYLDLKILLKTVSVVIRRQGAW
jgi:lipopolysaccharide/colanic/teichoic acid biosynthesis glycosyltransferase